MKNAKKHENTICTKLCKNVQIWWNFGNFVYFRVFRTPWSWRVLTDHFPEKPPSTLENPAPLDSQNRRKTGVHQISRICTILHKMYQKNRKKIDQKFALFYKLLKNTIKNRGIWVYSVFFSLFFEFFEKVLERVKNRGFWKNRRNLCQTGKYLHEIAKMCKKNTVS